MLKTDKSIEEKMQDVEEGKTRYLLVQYVSPEQMKLSTANGNGPKVGT
jgi:hypothetical protein